MPNLVLLDKFEQLVHHAAGLLVSEPCRREGEREGEREGRVSLSSNFEGLKIGK